jgi:hypothetical protein
MNRQDICFQERMKTERHNVSFDDCAFQRNNDRERSALLACEIFPTDPVAMISPAMRASHWGRFLCAANGCSGRSGGMSPDE